MLRANGRTSILRRARLGGWWDRHHLVHLLLMTVLILGEGCIPAVSRAQQAPGATAPVPPIVQRVDPNGVDLNSGSIVFQQSQVSIGPADERGLKHGREYAQGIYVDENAGSIAVQVGIYYVSVGRNTFPFTLSSGVFTDALQGGNSLAYSSSTQVYTFTDRNGVVATFSAGMAPCSLAGQYAMTSLTFPNGVSRSYSYSLQSYIGGSGSCWALRTVKSNTGYMLKYVQGPTVGSVQAINNAVDYCDPASASCLSLTQTWPVVTINPGVSSGGGATNHQSWSTSDPMGRSLGYVIQGSSAPGVCDDGLSNFITSVTQTRPAGGSKVFGYGDHCSGNGTRVLSVTHTGAGTWTYGYVPAGLHNPNLASTNVSGPNGQYRSVSWVVASVVGGANPTFDIGTDTDRYGNVTTYGYDSYGHVTSITHPEGNIDEYAYDVRGNVLSETKIPKPGSVLANVVTSAGYDATCVYIAKCNKPNWTKDANGNQTDYAYDNNTGLIVSVTFPAGVSGVRAQTRYGYSQIPTYAKNSNGSLVQAGLVWMLTSTSSCANGSAPSCVGTADETRTTFSYSGSSNALITSVTRQAGDGSLTSTTSTTYDMVGNVATEQGPLGANQTTQHWYDADREQIGLVGPHPDAAGTLPNRATRTTYNADGKPTLIELGTAPGQSAANWQSFAALKQTVNTYDSLDRLLGVAHATGGITSSLTQYSYDLSDRLQCVAVRMNAGGFSSLPASACSLGAVGPDGPDRITYNTYDNDDRLTQVVEGYGVSTVQRTARSMTYSANGNKLSDADANSNLTSYVYDGFDRLSTATYPAGAGGAATIETLTYDPNSNVVQDVRRDGQVITKTYDALNHVTAVSNPVSNFSFNNEGELVQASRNGITYSYAYDAFGRQTAESGSGGAIQFAYDAADNRTQITWPDSFSISYSFDLVAEVTSIQESATSGGMVLASYTYNNYGQRASVARGNGITSTYTYDGLGRLGALAHSFPTAQASNNEVITIGRNEADQIISRVTSNSTYDQPTAVSGFNSYSINSLNQIASSGGASFSYDLRGNLISDGVASYTFDASNNLIGNSSTVSLVTDARDRLVYVEDLTAGVVNGSSRGFRYDHRNVAVGEYGVAPANAGVLYRRYVPGPDKDEVVVWYDSVDAYLRRWLLPDERGSVIAVTSVAGGLIAANTYNEYGVPGAGNLGRMQYTGQMWMPELGLYHYKARAYSPSLGRFLQSDPIGYKDDANLYAYVAEDPLDKTDTSGTEVIIQLLGYRVDASVGAPVYIGHSFEKITSTTTGQSWIVRSGPSVSYPGNASDAARNTTFANTPDGRVENRAELTPLFTEKGEHLDQVLFDTPGRDGVVLSTMTKPDSALPEVLAIGRKDVANQNEKHELYQPDGPGNSNRFAADAYRDQGGDPPFKLQFPGSEQSETPDPKFTPVDPTQYDQYF